MEIKQIFKRALPDNTIVRIKLLLNRINNRKMLKKRDVIKAFEPGMYPNGINLIGDILAETGLGQSMRILASILEEGGIPFTIKQVDSPGGLKLDNDMWESRISDDLKYSINLIHINPNIWAENYNRFSENILNYRYNIAYWLWELEEFPDRWVDCIETVDEIWTPSEFISNCIRKKTNKTVETVPYSIQLDTNNYYPREFFKLPLDKFLFLTMYDYKSIQERKNPQAVIKAYKAAFGQDDLEVGLVIKINHLNNKMELVQLKQELAGYPNIYYIIDNLSRKEVESLIADSDALISLHRSEGFGLPLAEAMYLGTPVVATGWSANTEFMDKDCSCLVDYKLVKINKSIGPYEKGNYWADADVNQASEYMRKLYENKQYWKQISVNGKNCIRERLKAENALTVINKKIEGINR